MPESSLLTRLKYSYSLGPIAGIGQMLLFLTHLTLLLILEWFLPKKEICVAE